MARMTQGYIETSNVSVFDELVNNVEIQKQFQLNVKLILQVNLTKLVLV